MNLIYNAIQTPDGTILVSRHRHDFQSYTDANGKNYMIDGGLDYIRSSVHDDQISLAEYDTAPHERQRELLVWGTYGINGDQPLSYIKVCDMVTEHLKAVLTQCRPSLVLKSCMERELEARESNDS